MACSSGLTSKDHTRDEKTLFGGCASDHHMQINQNRCEWARGKGSSVCLTLALMTTNSRKAWGSFVRSPLENCPHFYTKNQGQESSARAIPPLVHVLPWQAQNDVKDKVCKIRIRIWIKNDQRNLKVILKKCPLRGPVSPPISRAHTMYNKQTITPQQGTSLWAPHPAELLESPVKSGRCTRHAFRDAVPKDELTPGADSGMLPPCTAQPRPQNCPFHMDPVLFPL